MGNQSVTVIPMLRAVPATMLIAASTLAALRSGIFSSAILRISSLLMLATLSRWGTPEPCSMLQAFLSRTAAGGVLVTKDVYKRQGQKSAFLVKAILDSARQDALESTLRRILREELQAVPSQPVRQPEETIPPEMLGFLNTLMDDG